MLSFGASVVGFGLGWSSLAADYTVNYPEDVNGPALFWLTYAGLNIVSWSRGVNALFHSPPSF